MPHALHQLCWMLQHGTFMWCKFGVWHRETAYRWACDSWYLRPWKSSPACHNHAESRHTSSMICPGSFKGCTVHRFRMVAIWRIACRLSASWSCCKLQMHSQECTGFRDSSRPCPHAGHCEQSGVQPCLQAGWRNLWTAVSFQQHTEPETLCWQHHDH